MVLDIVKIREINYEQILQPRDTAFPSLRFERAHPVPNLKHFETRAPIDATAQYRTTIVKHEADPATRFRYHSSHRYGTWSEQ